MGWFAITAIALLLAGPAQAGPRQPQDSQAAHIAAHVPASGDFDAFLERDLKAFLGDRAAGRVEVELLRDAPTQSGASWPKFYAWVQATAADGRQTSGAVRVAAIDRLRFEVTDFVSRDEILSGAVDPGLVFPEALVEVIRDRASLAE